MRFFNSDASIGVLSFLSAKLSVLVLRAPLLVAGEEAVRTAEKRAREQKEPCHWEKVGERFVVYRTRDRKVMKSLNYFRPDLSKFFTDNELLKLHQTSSII